MSSDKFGKGRFVAPPGVGGQELSVGLGVHFLNRRRRTPNRTKNGQKAIQRNIEPVKASVGINHRCGLLEMNSEERKAESPKLNLRTGSDQIQGALSRPATRSWFWFHGDGDDLIGPGGGEILLKHLLHPLFREGGKGLLYAFLLVKIAALEVV